MRSFRITTLWVIDRSDPDQTPYLLESYDELTEDSHGGVPDFFQARIDKLIELGTDEWRIVDLAVNFSEIRAAFEAPPVEAEVAAVRPPDGSES